MICENADVRSMTLILFYVLRHLLMENSQNDDQAIVQIPSMARLTM